MFTFFPKNVILCINKRKGFKIKKGIMKKLQLKQIYLFNICGNDTTAISLRSKQWFHNTPEDTEGARSVWSKNLYKKQKGSYS